MGLSENEHGSVLKNRLAGRRTLLSLSALLMLWLVMFYPMLFQGRSIVRFDVFDQNTLPWAYGKDPFNTTYSRTDNPHDPVYAHIWEYAFFWNQVKAGKLPLWNPYVLGGIPLVESTAYLGMGFFDLINLFLDPLRGFSISAALYVLLALIAMFFLLRHLGISSLIATALAFAYGFNGLIVSQLAHLAFLATLAFLPLVIIFFDKALETRRVSYAFIGGLIFGIMLWKSIFQIDLFTGILLVLYAVFKTERRPFWHRENLRALFVPCAILLGTGTLIGAIRWVPGIYLYLTRGGSMGGAVGYQWSAIHSLINVPYFVTSIFPNNLVLKATKFAKVSPFGMYAGTITAITILWYVCAKGSGKPWRWALLWLFTLIIPETPLGKYSYHRIYIIGILFMVVAAALILKDMESAGAWRWRKHGQKAFKYIMIGLATLAVGSEVFGGLVYIIPGRIAAFLARFQPLKTQSMGTTRYMQLVVDRWGALAPGMIVPAIVMLMTLFLFRLRINNTLTSKRFRVGVFALLLLDIGFCAKMSIPTIPLDRYPIPAATEDLQTIIGHSSNPSLYRIAVFKDNAHWPLQYGPAMSHWGLCNLHGHTSLFTYCIAQISPFWRLLTLEDPKSSWPYLNAQGVRWIISAGRKDSVAELGYKIRHDGAITIYENEHAFPKAWLVNHTEIMARAEVLGKLSNSNVDLGAVALIEDPDFALLGGTGSKLPPVSVICYEANRMKFETIADQEALLVVNDTYTTGWKARVDGRSVRVWRVNGAMRGVRMPPGKHMVELYYRPFIWIASALMTAVGLGFGILGTLVTRKRTF